MNVLLVNNRKIPVFEYGGTERGIWYIGRELVKRGHRVFYLVKQGSYCDFATVLFIDETKKLTEQIPDYVDVVHFQDEPDGPVNKPYLFTMRGNRNDFHEFDINTVFISRNQAARYGSTTFVYNGLDWDDYGKPALDNKRNYFHFLAKAAWRLKNVKGAINVIKKTKSERLKVLGGTRLNFSMGFRLTLSTRVDFCGNVGGEKKNNLLQNSKGLLFPVKWHEPFGLAVIESLYLGCPVFATPYGSLPELVIPEVGFLTNNSTTMAEALAQVDTYSRKRCHEYARDTFNSGKLVEAYLKKYELVMNGYTLNEKKPRLVEQQQEKFLPWY